ncbi:LysM peptidoglycan-binding domain-containing protein [Candidatus Saccharibacteria bacterium]|nr:LysM peptidoglycan-binding domain-containing protein [Candidatus Saccharibacteria bacterium]
MTSKKRKELIKRLKAILPYFATGVITLALVSVGSIDKNSSGINLSLSAFADSGYNVSVDQMSAMYVVADVSNALNLASAQDVASNYVIVTSMRDAGQSSTGKIEKPTITDIVVSRGVLTHTVADGETMEAIAAFYGITTDQIRWSNGKKNTSISVGEILYIPSVPGIVYTVKAGQTIEQIAEKYGSSVAEIIALNDLEKDGISEGARILIKGGVLPEKERPEYVPPRRVTYTYTYLGNTAQRLNIEVIGYFYNLGGPYGRGQCTQWAWYKRSQTPKPVPGNWGNARDWAARAAAQGVSVTRGAPQPGDVFQSGSGWYGHVGYVEAVNADGSIVASEMNYNYVPYRAIRSTIPATTVQNLNFIH